MKRNRLLRDLRKLGIDDPERFCEPLTDDAIAGTVQKAKAKLALGQNIGGGLVVNWLKDGGDEGYGTQDEPGWWQTAKGRQEFIDVNSLDPEYAEAAIISLADAGRTPTLDLVCEWAIKAESQQEDYDAVLEKQAQIEKGRLSGADRSAAGRQEPQVAAAAQAVRSSAPESRTLPGDPSLKRLSTREKVAR